MILEESLLFFLIGVGSNIIELNLDHCIVIYVLILLYNSIRIVINGISLLNLFIRNYINYDDPNFESKYDVYILIYIIKPFIKVYVIFMPFLFIKNLFFMVLGWTLIFIVSNEYEHQQKLNYD